MRWLRHAQFNRACACAVAVEVTHAEAAKATSGRTTPPVHTTPYCCKLGARAVVFRADVVLMTRAIASAAGASHAWPRPRSLGREKPRRPGLLDRYAVRSASCAAVARAA